MFVDSFSIVLFFIGAGLAALAFFDPAWFWKMLRTAAPRFAHFERTLRHGNLRFLLAITGGVLMYAQMRAATDAFFNSIAGQTFFIASSAVLLFLALRHRPR